MVPRLKFTTFPYLSMCSHGFLPLRDVRRSLAVPSPSRRKTEFEGSHHALPPCPSWEQRGLLEELRGWQSAHARTWCASRWNCRRTESSSGTSAVQWRHYPQQLPRATHFLRDSELVLLETSCPSLPFQGSRQSYLYLSTHYCRQGCCIIYQIIASLRAVSVLRIPAVTTTLDTMSVYKSKTLIIFLPFITLGEWVQYKQFTSLTGLLWQEVVPRENC